MRRGLGFFRICISCFVLSLLACDNEDCIPKVVDQLVFDCPEQTSNIYFEGFIGGEPFCYYDGVDDYQLRILITSAFVTYKPTTSTSVNPDSVDRFRMWGLIGFQPQAIFPSGSAVGYFPNKKHQLFIHTPSHHSQIPAHELFKNHLYQVGNLPLQSDQVADTAGFNIVFRFPDHEANTDRMFEAAGGDQTDSYVRITELDIDSSQPGINTYMITFEFSCNLYYMHNPKRFYKQIENGIMHVRFSS